MNNPVRRLRQLDRVLTLVECLSPLRCGARLDDLTRDVSDFHGEPVSERTIRRDLKALELFGLVESPSPGRWRFVRSGRSVVFAAVAELRAEQTV